VDCPRCQEDLRARSVARIPVHHCAGCDGLLVEIKHTLELVQALGRQLEQQPGLDDHIEPVPHDGLTLHCPAGHPMTSSGYMGARIAIVDRCAECQVLFIDGPEVEPLVRQYLRTAARTQERRDHLDEQLGELDKRVTAMLMARAATKGMGGGF